MKRSLYRKVLKEISNDRDRRLFLIAMLHSKRQEGIQFAYMITEDGIRIQDNEHLFYILWEEIEEGGD